MRRAQRAQEGPSRWQEGRGQRVGRCAGKAQHGLTIECMGLERAEKERWLGPGQGG